MVKLSYGEDNLREETESHDEASLHEKVAENHLTTTAKINVKYEENTEAHSEPGKLPEHNLEELLSMVEKTNSVLEEFKTTQDSFLHKIQELSNQTKIMEYNISYLHYGT